MEAFNLPSISASLRLHVLAFNFFFPGDRWRGPDRQEKKRPWGGHLSPRVLRVLREKLSWAGDGREPLAEIAENAERRTT